jgi:hypothetical protein
MDTLKLNKIVAIPLIPCIILSVLLFGGYIPHPFITELMWLIFFLAALFLGGMLIFLCIASRISTGSWYWKLIPGPKPVKTDKGRKVEILHGKDNKKQYAEAI